MALIVQTLVATPNPTSIPVRLDLRNQAMTDQGQETAESTYVLDSDHDLWFSEASGLSKRAERSCVVSGNGSINHRVKVVRGTGNRQRSYGIRQTVVDEGGRKTRRSTSVVTI